MTDMYRGYGLDASGNAVPITDPGAVRQGDVVALAEDSNKLAGLDAGQYLRSAKVGDGLSVGDDGTLSVLKANVLWEGTWDSGTITVPNQSKYTLFRISMHGQGTSTLAVRAGTYIRGIGGYSSATPTITTYHFAATFADNGEWTFVACNSMQHKASGNHSDTTDVQISSIMGLL